MGSGNSKTENTILWPWCRTFNCSIALIGTRDRKSQVESRLTLTYKVTHKWSRFLLYFFRVPLPKRVSPPLPRNILVEVLWSGKSNDVLMVIRRNFNGVGLTPGIPSNSKFALWILTLGQVVLAGSTHLPYYIWLYIIIGCILMKDHAIITICAVSVRK